MLLVAAVTSVVALLLVSLIQSFWVVVGLLVLWSLAFAVSMPVRQAYLNDLIPSQQRATVLSFDSLLSSGGGVVVQPVFGRVADISGYALTFGLSAAVQAVAIPFLRLAQRTGVPADDIDRPADR
jgi:MFS family permease